MVLGSWVESPRNCEGCAKTLLFGLFFSFCELELHGAGRSHGAAPGPAPRLGSAGEECTGWAPSPPAPLSPAFLGPQLLRQLPHPLLPQPEPVKPGCSSKTSASLGCEPFHYLNTAVGLPSSWPYHLSSALLLPPLHLNAGLVSCCLSFPLPLPRSRALLFASRPRGCWSCYTMYSPPECKALSSLLSLLPLNPEGRSFLEVFFFSFFA